MAEGEAIGDPKLRIKNPPLSVPKPEIHQFTKSTEEGRQARRETVIKILEKRHARSENQRAIETTSSKIEDTAKSTEATNQRRLEEEQRVLYLRAELNQRASSFLAKVRELLSSKSKDERIDMEAELEGTTKAIPWTKSEVIDLKQKIGGLKYRLDELKRMQATFPSGREELNQFYREQEQKLISHRTNEERQRNLAELEAYKLDNGTIQKAAQQFDSYIVHGFNLTVGGLNSVLGLDADWKAKLEICVALRPAIAASSIKRGKAEPRLWSPLGIVMGEGVISNPSYTDTASVAESIYKRKSSGEPNTIAEYTQGFSTALSKTMGDAYPNELDLEFGAKPSAVFINLDYRGSSVPGKTSINVGFSKHVRYQGDIAEITYAEIFKAAEFVGLPVVVFKDGIAYEAKLNNKTKELILGREISPVEMTTMKPEIPQANFYEIERRAKIQLNPMALV